MFAFQEYNFYKIVHFHFPPLKQNVRLMPSVPNNSRMRNLGTWKKLRRVLLNRLAKFNHFHPRSAFGLADKAFA